MFFLIRHPLIYSPNYRPKLHTRNAVIGQPRTANGTLPIHVYAIASYVKA